MTLVEFYYKYFLINLSDYPNIGFDLEINKLLLILFIGIIIATIIVNFKREGESRILKKLFRQEALSEESAKTLEELGLNNFNTRTLISSDGRITKLIKRVGEVELTYEEYTAQIKKKGYKPEKIDFKNAKFYIKENTVEEAKVFAEKRNTSLLNTLLFCLLLLAIYVCLMLLMPGILSWINGIL